MECGVGRRSMGWRVLAAESVSLTLMALIAIAPKSAAAPPPRYVCPSQVEPLVALMLGNLASYTNRVIARSTPRGNPRSYVLTVGRPEFEPLPLSPDGALRSNSSSKPDPNLRQVFITTLERQTLSRSRNARDAEVYLQGFHWLFLTKSGNEWQLALLFSQIGTYPKARTNGESPTPPRESSQGILGQAIRTWLRDCNAGVIRPMKSNPLLDKTG